MNKTSIRQWIVPLVAIITMIIGLVCYFQTQGKYMERLDAVSKKTTENDEDIIKIKFKLNDISKAAQNPAHLVNKINDIEKEYRKEQEAIKLELNDISNATQNPAHLINRISDIEKDVISLQGLEKNYKIHFANQNYWMKQINAQITRIEKRVYEVATNISNKQ